ncbi:MAG: dihydroorotate dehydrogenase [Candidatus Bathyarchaeia archaeon]
MPEPDLSTQIGPITLGNPTMLASGVMGSSLHTLQRAFDAGAGAVVSKSIGLEPRAGYQGPTVVEVDCGYLNAIGLANPGVHEFARELEEYGTLAFPLIASVFGGSAEEISAIIRILDGYAVSGFELNLSCPHVKGAGVEVASNPELVREIVHAARSQTSKILVAKLSAGVTSIVKTAEAAVDGGADALCAMNTLRAMAIDIQTSRPLLSNVIGGLSGSAIKPVAVRCVYEISEAVDKPVIGCGGVQNWQDALEFLLAGASAVQMGTALTYKGFDVFREVVEGLRKYMIEKNVENVKNLVGLAHTHQ